MNRHTIPLGRILGIPIGLDYSWFLIFGLITWTMAVGYYPAEFKDWPIAQYWVVGAATAIMLFVSVLLHELGHSVVAMRYKIPVRSITLFIFGGVSLIGAEPPTAVAGFWIAIVGPAVSFALAMVFRLMEPFLAGVPSLGSRGAYVKQFLRDKLLDHKNYIHKHGEDMPEIRNWKWCPAKAGKRARKRRGLESSVARKGPGKEIK
jgi:Zn-dependent protease